MAPTKKNISASATEPRILRPRPAGITKPTNTSAVKKTSNTTTKSPHKKAITTRILKKKITAAEKSKKTSAPKEANAKRAIAAAKETSTKKQITETSNTKTSEKKHNTETKTSKKKHTTETKTSEKKHNTETTNTSASKKRKAEDASPDEKPTKKTATANNAVQREPVKKASKRVKTPKPRRPIVIREPQYEWMKYTDHEYDLKRGRVTNTIPDQVLDVLAFGANSYGELGLGTRENDIEVAYPRFNERLAKEDVVQVSAGSRHCIALTADNKILTWGSNESGQLGRDTTTNLNIASLLDPTIEPRELNDTESGLNEREAVLMEVTWRGCQGYRKDMLFSKVVAGESCSFALTTDGYVFGWGTFRLHGVKVGLAPWVIDCPLPRLVQLKNIVDIGAGHNHAIALDKGGLVYAWGSNDHGQLGRRIVRSSPEQFLRPHLVGMPRSVNGKIAKIAVGACHNFAITAAKEVYAWGSNSSYQTGIKDHLAGKPGAVIQTAQHVKQFSGLGIVEIAGGLHHTIAATEHGATIGLGLVAEGRLGIQHADLVKGLKERVLPDSAGQPAVVHQPIMATSVQGNCLKVSTGLSSSLVCDHLGRAYSSGSAASFQLGTGSQTDSDEFVEVWRTATDVRHINGVHAGEQFGLLTFLRQEGGEAGQPEQGDEEDQDRADGEVEESEGDVEGGGGEEDGGGEEESGGSWMMGLGLGLGFGLPAGFGDAGEVEEGDEEDLMEE